MAASFRASYKGIGDLLTSKMMQAEMLRRAEKVKAAAVAIAPDATPLGVGYIDAFEIDVDVRPGKPGRTPRARARVRNAADYALFVEFGGRNTPKHRTLGKALDAASD